MPTTRKETRSVVPKREVVRRDRGWRWGVIAEVFRCLEADWRRYNTVIIANRIRRQAQLLTVRSMKFTRDDDVLRRSQS